jgi:hypothetical protein
MYNAKDDSQKKISHSLGISRLPVRFFKMTALLSKAHLCCMLLLSYAVLAWVIV